MNIKVRNYINKTLSLLRNSYIFKYRHIIKTLFNIKGAWEHYKDETTFNDLYKPYRVKLLHNSKLESDICILTVSGSSYEKNFLKASEDLDVNISFIDPFSVNWYEQVVSSGSDGYLFAIQHDTKIIREGFREKMDLLYLNDFNIWPTKQESFVYESKRRLAYFLKSRDIPHPKTKVFFDRQEAISFVKEIDEPLIMKTDMGASSSGIALLKSREEKLRAIEVFFKIGFIPDKRDHRERDWGYIIFQQFLPHVREHRIIKIGDFWFGHEKLPSEDGIFHSGSGKNSWNPPTERLLNFCRNIARNNNIHVASFDVFETENQELLINEIQTWFGSYNPSQMYIDGIPGAFVYESGMWVFKKGLYNINGSANLRLIEFDKYLKSIKQQR